MTALDVTDATFEADVLERSDTVPVVIDLWAPWCGPCRTLGPIIEQVVDATEGAAALAKVRAPVLIVQGDNDLQVKVEDAQRLAAAQPRLVPPLLQPVENVLHKPCPAPTGCKMHTTGARRFLPLSPWGRGKKARR